MASYQDNDDLPFDVLGVIFSYYVKDETILHPLETLLLVCKAWSDAALGHLTLWSDLRIYIGHEQTSNVWSTRLPLRLARCGPEVPLDIDLRYFLETRTFDGDAPSRSHWDTFSSLPCELDRGVLSNMCGCVVPGRTFVRQALGAITGLNGKQCTRWRSFTLDLGDYWCPELEAALSHPTPILQKLVLKNALIGVGSKKQRPFPRTTILRKLSLFQCYLPSLPNCEETLVEAKIEWAHPMGSLLNLSLFSRTTELQILSLQSTFGAEVPLPARLDRLRVLKLGGNYLPLPPTMRTCQMPMLSWLVLNIKHRSQLDPILEFTGLRLATLSRLTLTMYTETMIGDSFWLYTLGSVSTLLSRVEKLEYLEGNSIILSMVVTIMWQSMTTRPNEPEGATVSQASTYPKQICLTNMEKRDTVKLDGTETAPFFEYLVERWRFGLKFRGSNNLALENGKQVARPAIHIIVPRAPQRP